jgi:hypothetical protein
LVTSVCPGRRVVGKKARIELSVQAVAMTDAAAA